MKVQSTRHGAEASKTIRHEDPIDLHYGPIGIAAVRAAADQLARARTR